MVSVMDPDPLRAGSEDDTFFTYRINKARSVLSP
jgi:hypothetical protein